MQLLFELLRDLNLYYDITSSKTNTVMWWFVDLDYSFEAAGDKSVGNCCLQLYVSLFLSGAQCSGRTAQHQGELTQEALIYPASLDLSFWLVGNRANLVWRSYWHEFVVLCPSCVLRQAHGNNLSSCEPLALCVLGKSFGIAVSVIMHSHTFENLVSGYWGLAYLTITWVVTCSNRYALI